MADSTVNDAADAIVGEHAPDAPEAPKKSVATKLVELAEDRYEFGCAPDGEPFAWPKNGALVTRALRGGRQSLRAELAKEFYEKHGAAASQAALADALTVVEGKSQQKDPTPLQLRVAEYEGRLLLDIGDATGNAIAVDKTGWQVIDRPPVFFRRTATTGALPAPVGGAAFDDVLWPHLNVAEKYRPLVLALLVAELMPNMPHVVVLLTGEQGTGKSTATGRLASILDPSPAQLRKPPRDVEGWTTAAAGQWVPALDNLSDIADWLSDAFCRASTGDGDVRRRLYTDGDLAVFAFRRCVIFNGIDVGAIRGDLADRLVHLALERIPKRNRRKDETLADQWRSDHPRVLGALLDLAVKVLQVLPGVVVEDPPRMADYAYVVAAVDEVLGTTGLETYQALSTDLALDAATSDPVLIALEKAVTEDVTLTAGELLPMLQEAVQEKDEIGFRKPWRAPRGWPATPRALTATLKRRAPTLRTLGWTVEPGERHATRSKVITWRLKPPAGGGGDGAERGQDVRRGGKDAADAAFAADALFPQVNGHAPGAAKSAAKGAANRDDAAGAANPRDAAPDAAEFAALRAHVLTCANEDHAANAASAAHSAPLLTCRRCRESATSPLIGGLCRRCAYPAGGDERDDVEDIGWSA